MEKYKICFFLYIIFTFFFFNHVYLQATESQNMGMALKPHINICDEFVFKSPYIEVRAGVIGRVFKALYKNVGVS